MAKYQDKKTGLPKRRFKDIFGDLSKETQIKLIESLSGIQNATRL